MNLQMAAEGRGDYMGAIVGSEDALSARISEQLGASKDKHCTWRGKCRESRDAVATNRTRGAEC